MRGEAVMETQVGDEIVVARTPRASLVDGAECAVRGWLEPGRFRAGDRLPTEEQLAAMLGISRGTLRSALRRLESSGEIVRRQGSGTFVGRVASPLGFALPRLRADHYTIQATAGALTVTAMAVEMARIGADAATALGVDLEQRGLRIRRCLSAGEVPVAVTHDTFHPDLRLPNMPALRAQLRAGRTVHETIEAMTGITFSQRHTQITSLLLGPGDVLGRQLELTAPTACLALAELTFSDGEPILHSHDVMAPGQVEVKIVQTADAPPPPPPPLAERR
jgi:GntR family phosphonate transport system transcriptional regulator